LSIILTYTGVSIYQYIIEAREKRWIRGAFNQYLSPHVIDQLMGDPGRLDLGGKEETITPFFSDVQGFTSISERLTAHELVAILNEYLTEMTDIILKYDGTVDKFEGDAIIAFFGAPLEYEDHARRACFVSLDMQTRLVEMRERWKEEGRPLIYMRIGLNTGPAIVGNMGSKQRFDFTMMGDTVNLASRLEGVNKQYGTFIMISEMTYARAKDFVEARELDRVLVVGKAEPIVVYELLARKGELDEALVPVLRYYADGLELYRARQWDHAIATFRKALTINPHDGPSQSMIKRCQEYKENPPPDDWNGAFQLVSK
ncbi:MAG: adenylate/guanylate cyclase domain-containing protein, partial [Candidatus Tectomicrobia bacterium]|nr:adenylate/guanylate cyclase domain-containing protein [Candidatus Tectomicrobia bacterium]